MRKYIFVTITLLSATILLSNQYAYCLESISSSKKLVDTFGVDLTDAINVLEKELDKSRDNNAIKYTLSLLYLENGSYGIDTGAEKIEGDPKLLEKAEKLLTELTKDKDLGSMAFYYLGMCQIQKKVDEASIRKGQEYLELAINSNSRNYKAYLKLHSLYLMQKKITESITLLSKAKDMIGDDAEIYHRLSLSYMLVNNYSKTIDNAKQALLIKDNNETKLLLASAYSLSGQYFDAKKILEDILKTDYKNKSALLGLSSVLDKIGNKESSLEILNKAIQYYPADTEVQKMLSELQNKSKDKRIAP